MITTKMVEGYRNAMCWLIEEALSDCEESTRHNIDQTESQRNYADLVERYVLFELRLKQLWPDGGP